LANTVPPPDSLALHDVLADALDDGGPLTLVCIGLDRAGTLRDVHGSSTLASLVHALRRTMEPTAPAGATFRVLDDRRLAVVVPLDLLDTRAWVLDVVGDGRVVLPSSQVDLPASLCVGLAAAAPGHTSTTLLDEVRAALRAAERAGTGHVAAYDERLRDTAEDRLALERELRDAVGGHGIRLALRPVVSVPGGAVVGSTAAVRWTTRWGATIPSRTTLAAAAEIGVSPQLGRWIIDRACNLAARDAGWLSVSLSVSQLTASLPYVVRRGLTAHGLDPALLRFTVAADELRAAPHAAVVLAELAALGTQVGIEFDAASPPTTDLLRTLPVSFIRLHADLVAGAGQDPTTDALLGAWARFAPDLDVEVVADGVDDEDQASTLAWMGIRLQQGAWPGRISADAPAGPA
jgi:EAL domain-containing protein (putative c-di-GMP-specific phosphodiesterase class I)